MIFKKDTTIRALIKGIYIKVLFNENGIITDFEELNSSYLKNVSLDIIKELIGYAKAKTSGAFKAVITIDRLKYNSCIIDNNSFNEIIIDNLLDPIYRKNIMFVMVGKIDTDKDEYDKLYNCELCKYFLSFNRTPKIKLVHDMDERDFLNIISKSWLKYYYFDEILINGSINYDLISLSKMINLKDYTIDWKTINDMSNAYLNKDNYLTPLDLKELNITYNHNCKENTISFINNKMIANNVKINLYNIK